MRGVVVLALAILAYTVLCEGQGSGQGSVISPTSKASQPTDATNDSGSGDDDEDFNNGSGKKPTSESTVEPTTDDEGSGGSGSGDYTTTAVPKTDESMAATDNTTDNTDLYIIEVPTDKGTPEPMTYGKTTRITDSVEPSTQSPTVMTVHVVTTESPTQSQATEEKTTRAIPVQETTTKARETTVRMTGKAPRTTVSPKTEPNPTKATTPAAKKTTIDVNAFAQNDDDDKEGFTLTTEVIAGVVGCALLALLLIAFLMYRLKKRDEGSYLLDDQYDKKMGNSDKEAFV